MDFAETVSCAYISRISGEKATFIDIRVVCLTVKMSFEPIQNRFREILRELPKEGRPINLMKKDSDRSQTRPETPSHRGKDSTS